jgi:exodeoxyribonuclease III
MRVLSWNVERLKAPARDVAAEIIDQEPDVVALQEYQPGRKGTELFRLLSDAGYTFQSEPPSNKGFCSALVSRMPLSFVDSPVTLLPETWSNYWVEARCGEVGISCVHVPVPRYRDQRSAYWEAIIEHCGIMNGRPHLLIGDFNTTHRIDEEGEGSVVPGEHWLRALEELDWQEAWRAVNGPRRDYTWFSKSNRGFRVDQAWLPTSFITALRGAAIRHVPRDTDLSDHSSLTVDLHFPH